MDLIQATHEGGHIAMPIASSGFVRGHVHSSVNDHAHHSSNTDPPPLSALNAEDHHHSHRSTTSYATKKGERQLVVKYKECLKNHAAAIAGSATDGCGEFMPSGVEGTLEGLKCSACSCHRNFHRKEIDGGPSSCDVCSFRYLPMGTSTRRRKVMTQRGLLVSAGSRLVPRAIVPVGAAMQTSESEEMEEGMAGGGAYMTARPAAPVMMRKRFRTKFTGEQKEKMLEFAERVGWRLQRHDDSLVQQFCQEIGVKRRVLRVWMHNNKHNYLAKNSSYLHLEPTRST